jgi:hypothetical protein
MDTTHFSVELPLGELLECAAVAGRFVDPDERVETGNVWLIADGKHRTWRAAGSAVALDVRGGADPGHYELLLPMRLVNGGQLVAGGLDTVTVATGVAAGRPAAELRGPGGVVTVTTQPGATPRSIGPMTDEETAATATLDVGVLREAVEVARQIPLGFDQRTMQWPAMRLAVSPGAVELTVEWPTFGIAHHRVPAATTGTAYATLMPGYLAGLLDGYPDGDVTVKLGRLPDDTVEVHADGWNGFVTAVDEDGDWLARAEDLLVEAFGPDATEGAANSYALASEPHIHGRFADGPPRLEMSTVVLVGVEPSADLLAELNDHNRHLGLARVALHGTNVVMQADLLVSSLDEAELRTTAAWIGEQTRSLAPVLAAVFGGTDPNRHSEESR